MYYGVWKNFNQFLLKLDTIPPKWEDKISLFCAHLIENNKVQSSTLKSYMSALKLVLEEDGFKWDFDKILLSSLIRTCKDENDKANDRLPIKKAMLENLLMETERYFRTRGQLYLEYLYKCLFTLAYYALLRAGELTKSEHTLKAVHVERATNKNQIKISLISSKTHSKGDRPQVVRIHKQYNTKGSEKFFCPVAIILKYITLRKEREEDSEQFLVLRDGTPLTAPLLRKTLRILINNMNMDPSKYDIHSFHIGRAMDMLKLNYSIDQIKQIGRWRSNAVFAYLRD